MPEEKRVPETRFEGFSGEWEARRLGEIGKAYGGLSGKTKADFGHGLARYITYMNVFSNAVADPEMTGQVEIDARQHEVEAGDIFFTLSSETPDEVGMASALLEKRGVTYLNSFCFGFRPAQKLDSCFFAYLMRSPSARKKIVLLAQGISRYNISRRKMMEIEVCLPSLEEQQKIGEFFRRLDRLIALQRRKTEKLIQLKKGFLQKMFAS